MAEKVLSRSNIYISRQLVDMRVFIMKWKRELISRTKSNLNGGELQHPISYHLLFQVRGLEVDCVKALGLKEA